MKISGKRWQKAQARELFNWKNFSGIVESETEEINIKYKTVLLKISQEIKFEKSWKVLDLGCGQTCISRFLPPAQKYGVDPLAKELKTSGRRMGGVLVKQGRGEELPFSDKMFDLVICRNVLDHTNIPVKVVKETRRVIKKHGYFILACYVHPKFIDFLKKVGEYSLLWKNIEHPFSFTTEELRSIFLGSFKILKEVIIFEGKNSTDYGKVCILEKDRSLINKTVLFLNKQVFKNNWFVREYLFLLRVI